MRRFGNYYDLQAELCKERLVQNGPILEVGCGQGQLLKRLFMLPSYKIGMDVSRATIYRALTNLKIRRDVDLVIASAEALPFRDEAIGSIISFEVLEHLEHPKKAIGEFHRVLKPGGSVLLTTPNYFGLRNFLVQLTKSLKIEDKLFPFDLLHKYILRKDQLEAYFKTVGFRTVSLYPVQLGVTIPHLTTLRLRLHSPLATTMLLEATKNSLEE